MIHMRLAQNIFHWSLGKVLGARYFLKYGHFLRRCGACNWRQLIPEVLEASDKLKGEEMGCGTWMKGMKWAKKQPGAEKESWLWNLLDSSLNSQRGQPELESLQGGLSTVLENIAKALFSMDGQHNPTGQPMSPTVSINREKIMWEGGTRISCMLEGKL